MPKVTLLASSITHEVPSNGVLYDSLADQGLELPHGCLSGSCGACRINVIEGAANLAPPSLVEANTIESIREEYNRTHGQSFLEGKHIRLACRAKVLGDVVIDPMEKKK